MLSFITPPVALGAFAAAAISGSDPMRAGFTAMRIGSIIYFIPFFFVMEPALLLRGAPLETAVAFGSAVVGVGLIAGATQGYLTVFGRLRTCIPGAAAPAMLLLHRLMFAFPGSARPGIALWDCERS